MKRKHLMPLCLVLALSTMVEGQTGSDAAKGWQMAQVPPIPTRPIGPPAARRNAIPVPPPAPGAANVPGVPVPAPATPTGATGAAKAGGATNTASASTNQPAGDVADTTYNFPAIPVDQLLEIYADLVGRTLLRASSGAASVAATTTITLKTEHPLTRSEAIVALETVLGMNGITIVPIGDKFAKVVTEASAPTAGGLISSNAAIPEAGKFVTQIMQVRYASAQDLVEVLKPFSRMANSIIALPSTQTLILRDYAENVSRMMEMVKRIDVMTPMSLKPEVIPIKYALASDIASALSALGASGGTSVGKSSSGATSFSRGTGTSMTGTQGGVGGMGGAGGYPGQAMGTSALGSAATGARSSFQNNLQKIVSNAASAGQFQLFGQTKIIADERTNSLLVFANDDDMKMIKDIISKLDVVLAQVLIDAIVMEINLTGTESTGVSYLVNRQNSGNYSGAGGLNNLSSGASGFLTGSGGSSNGVAGAGSTLANLPGGFSYFSKFGNDLNVVLEAVAGDSRVNVLSRPRIQTSHAVPADLFIGNTVPYVTGTYNYGYGSGPSSQYTQLEVGIHLQVLPLINPDGLVVMDIQADVEQLGPGQQIAGVGSVPTTTKRQAGAKVAVRDGETIILGGFISDSRTTSDSGIPYLKNIPLLGNMFKSKSMQNLRTELVILLKPTVLPTPASAALVASIERNKLSGVKQAEMEIRDDEQKRNAAIDAQLAKEAEKRSAEKKKEEEKQERERIKNGGAPMVPQQNMGTNSMPPAREY
ncbi:MAG: secretin N-terminal domain-containing protein [Verrucomicrobiota bacterium]|jgi:general secretion pathway protein D